MINDKNNNYIKISRGTRDPQQCRDGKVGGPISFNGLCVVCWAQDETKEINKYRSWKYKTRVMGTH